jgi:hypothetical protein
MVSIQYDPEGGRILWGVVHCYKHAIPSGLWRAMRGCGLSAQTDKTIFFSYNHPAPPLKGGELWGDFFGFFLPRSVTFCVSRLEGRSVRSTERSEARKVATRSEA